MCECVCVCHRLCQRLVTVAGGRVIADTARPTKRVSVGAEAVEDAPLCICEFELLSKLFSPHSSVKG